MLRKIPDIFASKVSQNPTSINSHQLLCSSLKTCQAILLSLLSKWANRDSSWPYLGWEGFKEQRWKIHAFFYYVKLPSRKDFASFSCPKGTRTQASKSLFCFLKIKDLSMNSPCMRDGTERLHVKPIFAFVNLDFHLCVLFACCRNDLSLLSHYFKTITWKQGTEFYLQGGSLPYRKSSR